MPNKNPKKKPQETAKHIAAFWTWYELERNYKETISKLQVTEQTLAIWIKKFDWHKRADEIDAKTRAKTEKLIIDKNAKRRLEMFENHLKYGKSLISVGGAYLSKNGVDNGTQAIQSVKIGIDIERTAEGLATGKTETELSGGVNLKIDTSKLTKEQLAILIELNEKIRNV